jgi:hypothetical protein
MSTAPDIRLEPRSPLVYRVIHPRLGHVGNLKFAGGRWKFKAIGHDIDGSLIPGGGPYTHRHNASPGRPDAVDLAALLGEPGTAGLPGGSNMD